MDSNGGEVKTATPCLGTVDYGHRKCGTVTPARPNFNNPPLVEQVITVIFEELSQFSIGDFGLFWDRIRVQFPVCSTQSPLEPVVESFGGFASPGVQVRLVGHDVLPRCMYRSSDSGEIVQLQRDRFTFNWSYLGGSDYPHFEATLSRYQELLQTFSEFIADRGLSPLVIRQCEVTNVNIVPVSQFGSTFADSDKVFQTHQLTALVDELELEHTTISTQFCIRVKSEVGEPVGRLYTSINPVQSGSGELAWRFELTARSVPLKDEAATNSFFAVARSAINSAFMASTTPVAHKTWGLNNA